MRRKHSPDEPIVTITIMVEEKTRYEWLSVRERVVGILDVHHQTDIAVEIRRGHSFRADSRPLIDREDLTPITPTPGSSLDPRGSSTSSSTFGGFVELCLDGQWKTFGLTSFHCIVPGTANSRWEACAIQSSDSSNMLEVDQPGVEDILKFKEFRKIQSMNRKRD